MQTKALFTCTEAGYDTALRMLEAYRRSGMQVIFYGVAAEEDLLSLGEEGGMSHVLHFRDAENIRLIRLCDEMGGFTTDILLSDLLLSGAGEK